MRLLADGRRTRRTPVGFLGMIVLVALAEHGFIGRHDRLATTWSDDWRETGRAAVRKSRDRDLLCFGDSQVKSGVVPGVLESLTGRRAYNLAVGAGSPIGSYFLFRRALNAGARPRAVVLDAIPHILSDADGWYHRRLWPEMLGLRDLLDLAWTSRDPDLFAALLGARLVPSYRGRFEARTRIRAAFEGRDASEWLAILACKRNRRVNQGASVHPADPAYGAQEDLSAALFPPDWRCRELNATYLRRFLELAESHEIAVHWVVMPFRPDVEARRSEMGRNEDYSRFLRVLVAGHPGVIVHDARESGYDASYFVDPIHLNVRGAAALSTDLGRAIRAQLDNPAVATAPRWATMPAPQKLLSQKPIEDFAGSLGIVQGAVIRRR